MKRNGEDLPADGRPARREPRTTRERQHRGRRAGIRREIAHRFPHAGRRGNAAVAGTLVADGPPFLTTRIPTSSAGSDSSAVGERGRRGAGAGRDGAAGATGAGRFGGPRPPIRWGRQLAGGVRAGVVPGLFVDAGRRRAVARLAADLARREWRRGVAVVIDPGHGGGRLGRGGAGSGRENLEPGRGPAGGGGCCGRAGSRCG